MPEGPVGPLVGHDRDDQILWAHQVRLVKTSRQLPVDGLLLLVGRRKRMLRYLESTDIERYRSLIKRLGLRR